MKEVKLGIYGKKALAIVRLIASLDDGPYVDNMYSFSQEYLKQELGTKCVVDFCSYLAIDGKPVDMTFIDSLVPHENILDKSLVRMTDGRLTNLRHVYLDPRGEVTLKVNEGIGEDFTFTLILAVAKLGKFFRKRFTVTFVDFYKYYGYLVGFRVEHPSKKVLEQTLTPKDLVEFQEALSYHDVVNQYKYPNTNLIDVEANRIMLEEELNELKRFASRCEKAEEDCKAEIGKLKEAAQERLAKELATA